MKTGFLCTIAVEVMSALFLCSISISCFATESATKATAVENHYPYITNTLPVDGWVKKLIAPKSSPNFLYALITNYSAPKTSEKRGLHVFDISDVTRITEITYLPISNPTGMEMSLDEKTLFLYSLDGITILDVCNPKALRESGRLDLQIVEARLSADNKYLFVTELSPGRNNAEEYVFSIFEVSRDRGPRLLTRVKDRDSLHLSGNGFYPIPGDKHLLVDRCGKHIDAFDLSDPSDPQKEWEKVNLMGGYPNAIRSDGTLCLFAHDGLVLAKIFPEMEKLGTLQGGFSSPEVVFFNEETLYFSSFRKALHVVDVSDPKSPKGLSEYILPEPIGSATPARNRNLILVGCVGAIAVIDPNKAIVSSEQFREALKQYQSRKNKHDFEPIRNAIVLLKAAGIDRVMENKPSGISDKALAGILNDYGFFLTEGECNKEAIDIYKKAIQLDPDRAITYLNLGDSLRKLLSGVDSFEKKIEITKEVKLAYLQYKKLSGKSTPAIDSFLALNIVDTPIADFCEYVAKYANEGRLTELFGPGNSVLRADKQGTMQVDVRYGGTAQILYLTLIDNSTNEEISGSEYEAELSQEDDHNAWGQEIALIPFSDGHHLLHHNRGGYLVRSEPIGAALNEGKTCRFSVHVTEFFDKKAGDAQICKRIQSSEPLPYIPFDEPHSITDEVAHDAWFSATSVVGAGNVDFDNDGKTEVLVKLHYAGGGGRGCDYDFFDLLNEEKNGFSNSKKRQLLLELQGVEKRPNVLHPVPICAGNATGWFRYNGITYYETKYPGKQPKDEGQQFHTVSYIKNGKIHKVCDARFKIQIRAEQGHEATPKRLRKSEPQLSVNDKLLQAAGQGNLEAVKTLLAQGGDLTAQHEDGRTVLMQAVLSGSLELVRFLVDEGADVNAKDQFGTALMYAAQRGHLEIMKLLLDKGAGVNATDKYGHTALLYAARSGNLEAVKLFIDKGADVKAKTDTGETVLLGPAGSGNLELVKLLVDKGADVHAEGVYGGTALLSAASQGNLEVMKFLMDRGVDVRTKNQKGDTALMSAASRPKLEVLHFLIDRGLDVNAMDKYGDTALMRAAGSGNLEAINLLIDKGADVNATGRLGQTPLKTATAANRLNVMKLLIDKGADVNGKTGIAIPPIIEAVKKGNLDLVKFLLNHGADVNAKDQRGQGVLLNAAVEIRIGEAADADDATKGGETALMAAARSGNLELVKFLIDKGADVYAKDLYGGTVLMSAASQPKIEVLKFFIDKGLDVKTNNNRGDTTLMSAASHGNLEIMKFLVDRGVDVNAANKGGGTALTSVAGSPGDLNVFKFLIDRGADVNAKSKEGITALMRTSTGGNLEVVKYLIDKGADVNAKGEHGESPLLFATMADRLEVMKLLVDNGADVNGQGSTGYTTLMEAARGGSLEAVKFLIGKGADVNARDERGRMVVQSAGLQVEIPFDGGTDLDARTMVGSTALMAAVESGNLEVVKVLIANRADINVRCRSGETALSLASASNKPEIVQYLQAHGAKLSDEPPHSKAHGAKPSDEPPPLPPIEETKPRSR